MEGHRFSVEAMIRGHHIYKEIWTPVEGEVLPFTREVGNSRDPMAVAVKKELILLATCQERFRLYVRYFYRGEVLLLVEWPGIGIIPLIWSREG